MKTISIITVCLNSADCIDRAISSVVNQIYKDIEYIVIDGGSRDGTLDIIEKYRDKIDYFVSGPDGGIYDAMNKGIKAASGDVLFFLNSDDYFVDEHVVDDVMAVFDCGDFDVVCGDIIYVKNGIKTIIPSHRVLTRRLLAYRKICHQAMFIKKELFARVGWYDVRFKIVADYEWLMRALDRKFSYRYVNDVICVVSGYGVSGVENFVEEENIAMKRHYSDFEIWLYRTLPRWLAAKKNRYISM